MSTQKTLSLAEQRSRLERRANVIRSRLLRTIDALDNRRHQVQEIGHHAKRLAVPAVAGVLGVAVLATGTVFAIRALVERRRERRFSYRVNKALAPFRREEKPPFWQDALRKLLLTGLGVLASELAKRGARGMLEGRGPAALLPVHVEGHHPAPTMPPLTTATATGPSGPMLGR
jgi:hypothetical protein